MITLIGTGVMRVDILDLMILMTMISIGVAEIMATFTMALATMEGRRRNVRHDGGYPPH
jgi:hypothetical protein